MDGADHEQAWQAGEQTVHKDFEKQLADWKSRLRNDADETSGQSRWQPICEAIGGIVAARFASESRPAFELEGRLDELKWFISRLDSALHQESGPFSEEGYRLWLHRDMGILYRDTKPSERDHFADVSSLRDLAKEYLNRPWLHGPYLDWVLLDSMTAAEIVSGIELVKKTKLGFRYVMFDGVGWKMALWRVIMTPVSFLVGWVLPAAICYYIAQWSLPIAIGVGVVYYGFSFWLLARWLWAKFSSWLSRTPTGLKRAAILLDEMGKTYASLAGPVLHVATVRRAFERATEAGVTWDQQVFYILDHIADRKPTVWDTEARADYASP